MQNSGSFPSTEEFVSYMNAFVDKYSLKILERSEILDISLKENGFRVYLDDFYMDSKFLVMSTGTFNNPYIPDIKGIEDNPAVIHSSKITNSEPFTGKRVAIIGAGNSGIELALALSAKADVSVLCRGSIRYFSETGNITDVRGVSESLFKEMIGFKIVSCYENCNIKGLNNGTIFFEDMDPMEFDSVILATGYRPVLLPVMGGFHEAREKGYPVANRFGESTSMPGLYYAGGIVGPERQNAFIHCFRRKIPRMMFAIRRQLNLRLKN
jgi:putative flavoprotein involved in K+ transport